MKEEKIRIAALGDLHVRETSQGAYHELLTEISKNADILVLCGDLTDLGLMTEAEILVKELASCTIPVVGVLGNHDYENDNQQEITKLLVENKISILEGTEYIFEKNGVQVGITGVKGFGGGFRPNMWGRFGEKEQKAFYDAIAGEVQQLENGLNRLQSSETNHNIVLLHFSPIRDTLQGEIPELYAFLGSTRLEEVIDRYKVNAVFHAHAHYGSPKGKTEKNIPVYNVAYPLMQKTNPKQPYGLIEI